MTKKEKQLIQIVRSMIDGAYHDRNDYPPFELNPFSDRATYHAYILKIIDDVLK